MIPESVPNPESTGAQFPMIRFTAIMLIGVLLVVLIGGRNGLFDDRSPSFDLKHNYLVVTIEGPPKWNEENEFSIQWDGRAVPLPIVIRAPAGDGTFQMGAEAEIFNSLRIGNKSIPVTAKGKGEYRTRNTGAFAFIQENTTRRNAVGASFAYWVEISPPDYPGLINPIDRQPGFETAGKNLKERLSELLAAGKVIDVSDPR